MDRHEEVIKNDGTTLLRAPWDRRRLLERASTTGDNNRRGVSVWRDRQGKYHVCEWGQHSAAWTHDVAPDALRSFTRR